MADGIFGRYEVALRSKKVLGNPKCRTKALAIRYTENPPATFDGVSAVRILYDAMADNGWEGNKNKGKNWHWRKEEVDPIPESGNPVTEVPLERHIASLRDPQRKEWTWQMSTSSGVQNLKLGDKHNAPNKRRSIDLVRNHGNDRYSFVELKVGADNPLYALFEILGYALAYLHARDAGQIGTDTYNVMQAKHIGLVVLGPVSWYQYKHRNDSKVHEFDLEWMGVELAKGLNDLSKEGPTFSISFERFGEHENVGQASADIIGQATRWPTK
jgi:hypothetical protein